ncbi:dimethylarginine dimethylaminohydrolase family protein [Salinirubellus sp. GCM10025818]|uniref:dimethylarginine dimethylaminohydrolase family protein n=1 Tax=Salinirubellus TaxID=2162630 RepID=UPI0030CE4AC7
MPGFEPSVRTDVGSLERVLVHEPGEELTSVVDPDAWGWRGLPRRKRAAKEHARLVEALESNGVTVHELGEVDPDHAESLFVRDVGFAIEGGFVVGKMHGEIRRGEGMRLSARAVELDVPIYHTVHGHGRFEVGNVVWLDEETVAVGRSMTTNAEGIRQVRSVLDTYGVELIEVPIFGSTESTGQTHLALVFGMVAPDLALLYPQAVPTEFRNLLEDRGVETVDVPRREQRNMSTSSVVVDPGHVLLPGACPETRRALRDRGIEVTEIDIREIRKARGGLKGLVLPLERSADPGA